jgi:hypothetical protein
MVSRTKEWSIVTAIARPNDWQVPAVTRSDDDARVGVGHRHRSDVIDVSRPPSRDGLWKMRLEWLEASALVLLAVLTPQYVDDRRDDDHKRDTDGDEGIG